MVLTCTSLVTNDIEHIFISLLFIWLYYFVKFLLEPLCHFSIVLLVFYLLIYIHLICICMYIYNSMWLFCQIYASNICTFIWFPPFHPVPLVIANLVSFSMISFAQLKYNWPGALCYFLVYNIVILCLCALQNHPHGKPSYHQSS